MPKASQIIITGMGSISPIGADPNTMWRNYRKGMTKIQNVKIGDGNLCCAPLSEAENDCIDVNDIINMISSFFIFFFF